MIRFSALLITLFTLGAAGCDSGGTDAPLPSFDELRRDFAGQPDGHGLVREDDNDAYETSAVHFTSRNGDLSTFVIDLTGEFSPEGRPSIGIVLSGVDGDDLQTGAQFEGVGVSYGGPGCIGSGSGRLEVTSVRDSLIAGVFAADVSTTTLVPCNRRLTGGFTAVLDSPED